jgi:predicted nuclease of restriction endonuclease-like (RecB) superfamily
LILLYWDIGRTIVEGQKTKGYGKQVVERLAEDLQKEFPGTAGFSPQNVWHMRSFYLGWTKEPQKLQQPVGESTSKILPQLVGELAGSNLPQPVAEIPWGHNLVLLAKLKTPLIRLWYAHKVIERGWSRAVLTHHIETQLHKREGRAVTNFQRTLAPPRSDLAEQTLKDPYSFDLTVEYALRDLKKPIGVAQWQTKLVESLPRNLTGSLPTVAEIEAELDNARPK